MPVFDLASPTQLIFEWGWFLMTRANFAMYALLLVIFVLGITIPLPRSKGEK